MTGKRSIVALLAALVALIVIVISYRLTVGPDISQFAPLREPRLTHIDDQRVLMVHATGEPDVVSTRAFKSLFDAYFKLDGISRMSRPPAPRARWPQIPDTPKDTGAGQYALPVPNTLTTGPDTGGVTEAIWTYGEVAEILHVGRYSEEQATIRRLRDFIASRGYRVVGEPEEEYVKGPRLVFGGNPDKYLTIIRLRVEDATQAQRRSPFSPPPVSRRRTPASRRGPEPALVTSGIFLNGRSTP